MKRRLFMRLNTNEYEQLCRLRDDVLYVPSFRKAIVVLCSSDFIKGLVCIVSLESELRRISTNLHQIKRKLVQNNVSGLESALLHIATLIRILVSLSSVIQRDDIQDDFNRREISIRMDKEEKELVMDVKKRLRFKNYRTMLLSLSGLVELGISFNDTSHEYLGLKEYGEEINHIAKSLNRGYLIETEQLNLFLQEFISTLKNIESKVPGGVVDATEN